jgi:hypothetical protein
MHLAGKINRIDINRYNGNHAFTDSKLLPSSRVVAYSTHSTECGPVATVVTDTPPASTFAVDHPSVVNQATWQYPSLWSPPENRYGQKPATAQRFSSVTTKASTFATTESEIGSALYRRWMATVPERR